MAHLLVFWTTVKRPAGFAILLAADCKSAGLKEVGAFLDDGLQIRRNEYTQTSSYISSKSTNVIPSYMMACVVYRINHSTKKYKPGLHWY